jgi:hypothetical protein
MSTSCGFEGPFFGASYPDGTCIDGFVWDLDSCDEPGGPLQSGGDIPCPHCNVMGYVEYLDVRPSGNSRQRRQALRVMAAKVKARASEWVS